MHRATVAAETTRTTTETMILRHSSGWCLRPFQLDATFPPKGHASVPEIDVRITCLFVFVHSFHRNSVGIGIFYSKIKKTAVRCGLFAVYF